MVLLLLTDTLGWAVALQMQAPVISHWFGEKDLPVGNVLVDHGLFIRWAKLLHEERKYLHLNVVNNGSHQW